MWLVRKGAQKRGIMKKVALGLMSVLFALPLAACSSGTAGEGQEATDSSQQASTDQQAPGELEDTLVVYSTHPEAMLEAVADGFEAETGVKVEFVNLKGELADRVQSEIGNPQADVMYGGDISVYDQLDKQGAFAATNPSWAQDLPSDFKSANGDWYGTITTPVVMFYNTDKLDAADAPKDWSDLTDSKYQGQIVARDYLSSSMRSAVCNLVYFFQENNNGGEQAAVDFLTGLDSNIKNYYNSGSMMFQSIGAGEASVGIATLNDVTDNVTKNGMPLQSIDAASGNVVISDCVAALKDCKHPNAAAAFVEYVGSKDTEVMLANDFNRIPSLPAAKAEAPEWMQGENKALPADWTVISENQADWLALWQDNIYTEDKTVANNK